MKSTLTVLLLCLSCGFAHKILCIFPTPTKSNDHLANGVVQALLKAGHKVTWATPHSVKDAQANLTIINLNATRAITEVVGMTKQSYLRMREMRTIARDVSCGAAENLELRRVLVEEQFDAVVTSWFINDFEAGYAAIQQVPWILLSSVSLHPSLQMLVDEVRSVSTVPLMLNECDTPMSTGRRLLNGLFYLLWSVMSWFEESHKASIYESMFAPLATARGVPLPPFHEAKHNVSIMLVNSHESIAPVYSLPPNVLNIAGYHIEGNPPPLPKLLDKSTSGVVYFSMGSILRSAALQPQTRAALLRVFAALPYTVLWKYEETIEDLPPNVHVRPWMPQASILAHKNVRLFISHGGLLSTLEAVYFSLPMLTVPVFGDQPANAERARRAGYALTVNFHDGMAEELEVALYEMLRNDTYHKRAQYLSKIFRARPVPPSRMISYYIELAIETNGAHHLRSLSLQYSWYERWMLDLVLLVFIVLATIAALLAFIIRTCFRKLTRRPKTKKFIKED